MSLYDSVLGVGVGGFGVGVGFSAGTRRSERRKFGTGHSECECFCFCVFDCVLYVPTVNISSVNLVLTRLLIFSTNGTEREMCYWGSSKRLTIFLLIISADLISGS